MELENEIIEMQPSTIETVDRAIFNWLNEEMNLHCNSNRGFKKVPVIWVASERAYQAKRDPRLRDKAGALRLPLITLERTGIQKEASRSKPMYNLPTHPDKQGGALTITRVIKQDKTANFRRADQKRGVKFATSKKRDRVVHETISIPMPVYVDVSYKIQAQTQYQQQINEITQPFITSTSGVNHFSMTQDGHCYHGFIQGDFSQENNTAEMDTDGRTYMVNIEIKVLAHLISSSQNDNKPMISRRENAIDLKISQEYVIMDTKDD